MYVEFGYAVERIPTNGSGGSAAARTGSGGAATLPTPTSISCAGSAGNLTAGDIVMISSGFWGIAASFNVDVVTVDRWRKAGGDPMRVARGPNEGGHQPSVSGGATWKAFPPSVLTYGEQGFYLEKIHIIGVAASTLVIRDCDGTVLLNVPSTVASPWTLDLVSAVTGRGIKTKGPFTVTPNNASILGNIIFANA